MKKLSLFVVFFHLIIAKEDKYFKNLGCWKDNEDRAVPTLEGSDDLHGPYESRENAIGKCYEAALGRGFSVFAVQNGGWCAANNGESYKRYGFSTNCAKDGKGGPWANQVYRIKKQFFIHAGCWKDTATRAVATLEGLSPFLEDEYTKRTDHISDCFKAVLQSNINSKTNYTYFAVQNGGWCAAGKTRKYAMYGISNDCNTNGKGGPWANDVYFLRNFEQLAEVKTEAEFEKLFGLK